MEWIDNELKLTKSAEKLRQQKASGSDLKTMVTIVLCSSDYYTEPEIKGLLKTLDEIIGMPKIKRKVIKANLLLKDSKYTDAAGEYEHLLDSKEAADLTPEEYGDVLHNLAVAKLHITGIKDTADIFLQAYEHNHKAESLRQYLYAVKLSNNQKLFEEKIKEYQVSDEFLQSIYNELEQTQDEASHSEMMTDISQLKNCIVSGRISEFYRMADDMIDSWKASIRQI
jgi:hypothetical protein